MTRKDEEFGAIKAKVEALEKGFEAMGKNITELKVEMPKLFADKATEIVQIFLKDASSFHKKANVSLILSAGTLIFVTIAFTGGIAEAYSFFHDIIK